MRVVLLPGAVMPAALAYEALLAELGPDVEAVTKELELYRSDAPPPDYSLSIDVDGVRAEVDRLGWERLHLVGYSAGGSVALAYAARDRVVC